MGNECFYIGFEGFSRGFDRQARQTRAELGAAGAKEGEEGKEAEDRRQRMEARPPCHLAPSDHLGPGS